ncbi:Aspartyl/Asparaginyl beta-hydroxylase [Prochlorococcus marinus str. MIT 1313]|nr:aspartyl/asparaginyl beta-hydroxylase domain-containing protein [Prochlorococcus marinus]KZR69415.1 Aspartyl/Asparaginyl beta-hydroxylase [Prochlorococcus marinus str. MIT 1313]KZR72639.1 Aspartyl/Asparaginyl beta-hydroxylase [Prochlorococcus marinus str. MIT 1318]
MHYKYKVSRVNYNYKFLAELEKSWQSIRYELSVLLGKENKSGQDYFQSWHERSVYHGDWKVFGLHAFGEKLTENCNRCPITTKIVEAIPGMTTAGFSAMTPQTRILPHTGYTNKVLRCHLGLIIPKAKTNARQGDTHKGMNHECGLRVGDTIYNWQPGKAFIFDDTEIHEAWNNCDDTRYILLIDFKKSSSVLAD